MSCPDQPLVPGPQLNDVLDAADDFDLAITPEQKAAAGIRLVQSTLTWTKDPVNAVVPALNPAWNLLLQTIADVAGPIVIPPL